MPVASDEHEELGTATVIFVEKFVHPLNWRYDGVPGVNGTPLMSAYWVTEFTTITCGSAITRGEDGSLHVPKKEMVTALQLLLQGRRMHLAPVFTRRLAFMPLDLTNPVWVNAGTGNSGGGLVDNVEANRLQIFFPVIPSELIRRELKRNGFHWSPTAGAWQRHRSNRAAYLAKLILTNHRP